MSKKQIDTQQIEVEELLGEVKGINEQIAQLEEERMDVEDLIDEMMA